MNWFEEPNAKVRRWNGKIVAKADALHFIELAAIEENEDERAYFLGVALAIMRGALEGEKRGLQRRGRPRWARKNDYATLREMDKLAAETGESGPWKLAGMATGLHYTNSERQRIARRWKASRRPAKV